ncbi:MAG: hypothetical protein JO069_15675 [Verrucomicrobia bacterium]|nr:hypothetical protein [Verrucomicrobiota bacterium]
MQHCPFATIRQERAEAMLVLEEPIAVIHSKRIAQLAAQLRRPTLFSLVAADAGGLLAYGTSLLEAMRHLATYVDKVLKGIKPGELPVETVTRYELIVNLKTARAIGISIPAPVRTRADQLLQ